MKSFSESVDIVYNEMLEKQAEMSQLAKNVWKGVGIGGLGGGALGAMAADPGHRGAGFMTGATLGGLMGAGAPYLHELTPMAGHSRKLEELGLVHKHDLERQMRDLAAKSELADRSMASSELQGHLERELKRELNRAQAAQGLDQAQYQAALRHASSFIPKEHGGLPAAQSFFHVPRP